MWEIWRTGYMTNGMSAPEPAAIIASVEASSFDDAVMRHVASLEESERALYRKDENGWTVWGCGLYPTRDEASSIFG